MIVEQTHLRYVGGSSDKVYSVWLRQNPKTKEFSVDFAYGRTGSTLQTGTKTKAPVPKSNVAQAIFQRLVASKKAKGYSPSSPIPMPPIPQSPFAHVPSPDTHHIHPSGQEEDHFKTFTLSAPELLPQLLNPATESEMQEMAQDSSWGFQPKFDGVRMMFSCANRKTSPFNRRGQPCSAHPATLASLSDLALRRRLVLDGESIGSTVFLFDLLELDDRDLRADSYLSRYQALAELFLNFRSEHLKLSPLALSTQEKQRMWSDQETLGGEGVVAKKLSAPYEPGRPASAGSQRKFKFLASASVLITAIKPGKRSAGYTYYEKDSGGGHVTIPPNHPLPSPGDMAEVRYLYAMRGSNALYQPVYLGARGDLVESECSVSQLKFKVEG